MVLTNAIKKEILVDLNVMLLGKKGDGALASFGHKKVVASDDFLEGTRRAKRLVSAGGCIYEGCKSAVLHGAPHGWTCEEHDATHTLLVQKRQQRLKEKGRK